MIGTVVSLHFNEYQRAVCTRIDKKVLESSSSGDELVELARVLGGDPLRWNDERAAQFEDKGLSVTARRHDTTPLRAPRVARIRLSKPLTRFRAHRLKQMPGTGGDGFPRRAHAKQAGTGNDCQERAASARGGGEYRSMYACLSVTALGKPPPSSSKWTD